MKEVNISPNRIWNFYPGAVLRMDLCMKILSEGWVNIPKVPIFKIPDTETPPFSYILIDGNHRRLHAQCLSTLLPCALYEYGESINIERDSLAYFKYHNDPKLYETLLKFYHLRFQDLL